MYLGYDVTWSLILKSFEQQRVEERNVFRLYVEHWPASRIQKLARRLFTVLEANFKDARKEYQTDDRIQERK